MTNRFDQKQKKTGFSCEKYGISGEQSGVKKTGFSPETPCYSETSEKPNFSVISSRKNVISSSKNVVFLQKNQIFLI